MDRRAFLKSLSAVGLAVSSLPALSCSSKQSKKPNIIFILADDLGYGELGCYGQEKIETPNIDALAQSGMTFTQFYSGAPVCAPARCVLMTGKHTGHAYIRGNDEWRERGEVWDFAKMVEDPNLEGQRPIPAGTETVGRLLQRAGYKTAIVGKWGLGGPLTEGIPNNQGFDFFYGYNCQRQAHTFFPKHLWKNREKVWLENELVVPRTKLQEGADPYENKNYSKFWLKQYSPDLMFNEIINFVQDNKNHPFFLYWATPIPHVPLQAPKRWVDYYVKKFGDEQPYLGDRGYFPHRYPHAAYAAMVSYLDEQIGLLVKHLKDQGLYENSIFFFSSDNGPTYAGGADSGYFDSAQPLRSDQGRGKGSVYEGGIRVPLIVSWPGNIRPGSKTHHISAFYDVLPTLTEIAGTDTPEKIDGISFFPTLKGQTQQTHEFLYWEFPASGGQQAVRMGKWKAMRRNILKGNLEISLFNLETDIKEENNVAVDHPEIVEKMTKIMKEQHVEAEIERFKMAALGDG
jgi:arylsulfatase